MPGYKQTSKLVGRELEMQAMLSSRGSSQVLNIPLVLGPVGAGKTAMAREHAAHHDLTLCSINSGENSDATDLSGVPVPSMIRHLAESGTAAEKRDAGMAYMTWVLNRYAAMACTYPVFLFFDDLDKAPPPVQSAMLGICGNRMFRDTPIHPHTLIMGAGNRVSDDKHAGEISESLRTRMTIVTLEPDVNSFVEYGVRTKEIHDVVLGYVQYKPEHLHQVIEAAARFPTPRGWWEVSQHFSAFPDPVEDVLGNGGKDNWRHIVTLKCGEAVGNDFWAWYKILSKVKPEEVLKTGDLTAAKKAPPNERRMYFYATIIALAIYLRKNGLRKTHVGIEPLMEALEPEMRVAFAMQLTKEIRSDMGTHFQNAASLMMQPILNTPTLNQ